jgi:hypothetical protein
MADERWQFIADRIRAADPTLTGGKRICLVANDLLNSKCVALAKVIDHAYSPVADTDDLGTFLDDQQFALASGPTFEAQRSPAPIILDDLHSHRTMARWPIFVELAQKYGIRGAYVFPLRIGDAYLGVLTAYRDRSGDLSGTEYADGLILASLATAELVRTEAGVGSEPGLGIFDPGLSPIRVTRCGGHGGRVA